MRDLFSSAAILQQIPAEDAEVYYLRSFELGRCADELLRELIAETPWRQETLVVWGKRFSQPRLVAWYGDSGGAYTYSGIRLKPLPWTDVLCTLRRRVEGAVGSAFNSVLLNYYRDHRDSMGFHSDDEPELGERPVIASVSLGEERIFVLRHKTKGFLKPIRLKLASGSLLLMKGETQRHWKHGIAKELRPCEPRVNLTFRCIKNCFSGDRKTGFTSFS
jgi:alkylated DNA repair dioxygenase AlkB